MTSAWLQQNRGHWPGEMGELEQPLGEGPERICYIKVEPHEGVKLLPMNWCKDPPGSPLEEGSAAMLITGRERSGSEVALMPGSPANPLLAMAGKLEVLPLPDLEISRLDLLLLGCCGIYHQAQLPLVPWLLQLPPEVRALGDEGTEIDPPSTTFDPKIHGLSHCLQHDLIERLMPLRCKRSPDQAMGSMRRALMKDPEGDEMIPEAAGGLLLLTERLQLQQLPSSGVRVGAEASFAWGPWTDGAGRTHTKLMRLSMGEPRLGPLQVEFYR